MTNQTAVQFRYDLGEWEQDKHYCGIILSYIGAYYPGIAGVETMNKYGETIKKHLHYNFIFPGDTKTAETFCAKIRKTMQRFNNELAERKRQRGYYSIVPVDVQDWDRFLRYPLKQVETVDKILQNDRIPNPPDFDVELQWKLANEEYLRDLEHLSRRREVEDKRQTTLQKIILSYTDKKLRFATIREVFDFVLQFYDDEGLIMERAKIRGVCDTIARKVGLIPNDEFFRMVYN